MSGELDKIVEKFPDEKYWNLSFQTIANFNKSIQRHLTGNEVTKHFENHFGLLWYFNLLTFYVQL
jgi:hypothetical protein